MKKKIIAIMLVLVVLITGCGNNTATYTDGKTVSTSVDVDNVSATNESETVKTEVAKDEKASNEEKDIASLVTDLDESSLNLKEYYLSFEDRDVDTSGRPVFPFEEFRASEDIYYLTGSVKLYIDNGCCIGYTKPDIEIIPISEYDGWYFIDLRGEGRFVNISEVKANGFAGTKQEYIESTSIKEEAETVQGEADTVKTENTTETVKSENTTTVEPSPTETETVVQDSNKYTPDEAIAVYRSLMEAGGIIWAPELKGVTSWGTGWIYLDKGQPEWCASTNLESFAMGDSAGNPWTKYYLEVTGSDESKVYITEWHN